MVVLEAKTHLSRYLDAVWFHALLLQPPDCLPFNGPHLWLSRDGHGAVVTGFNE